MGAPLEGEQVKVNVTLTVNPSGLLDLSFTDIPIEAFAGLLDSLSSQEFQETLIQKLNEEIDKHGAADE
jgi:hypothetical protein